MCQKTEKNHNYKAHLFLLGIRVRCNAGKTARSNASRILAELGINVAGGLPHSQVLPSQMCSVGRRSCGFAVTECVSVELWTPHVVCVFY